MAIWSSEIKELERLYESLKGQLPDLEKELERLIRADDENMILLYSRRCLEVIITDLCECELKRPRKTEPLKGIIDKLHKEEKVPSHIITSMHGLNELSTYGAHPKDFDPEQIKPVLNNLDIIIKWYLKYKNIVMVDKTEVEEEKARLKKESLEEVKKAERQKIQEKPAKFNKRRLISGIAALIILIFTAILAYPKIFKHDTLEELRSSGEKISVAIMPFKNRTNDSAWKDSQGIIQDILKNKLSNSEELIVRETESIDYLIKNQGLANTASMTPSLERSISKKLGANIFISGSINQAGDKMRLLAELRDSKAGRIIKPFQIEGPSKEENILKIIDSLSVEINSFLVISKLKKDLTVDIQLFTSTNSPKAYQYFIYGENARRLIEDDLAAKYYLQSITIDSNFTYAIIMLSFSYYNVAKYDQSKSWCLKVYRKREMMNTRERIWVDALYAQLFETPLERIKYFRQLQKIDNQNPTIYFQLGWTYANLLSQPANAIPEFEKSLEIYNNWDSKPYKVGNYTHLGESYHATGQFRKEKKLYKKAEQDFPDDPFLIYRQAILALSEGDKATASEYIDKYKSICRDNSVSDVDITTNVASIYSEAGILDIAEENYRQALSLEPDNPIRMNTLAYFLIDKDRNIIEGMTIVDKALEKSPENYKSLHVKGWGLYKQGKYQEALEVLQKSWDLRMKNAIYNHEAFLHLEAAKKAFAGQKNN
jgi:Tfp pilus assembly protein PilF/TolB-like protein